MFVNRVVAPLVLKLFVRRPCLALVVRGLIFPYKCGLAVGLCIPLLGRQAYLSCISKERSPRVSLSLLDRMLALPDDQLEVAMQGLK